MSDHDGLESVITIGWNAQIEENPFALAWMTEAIRR